MSINSAAEVKEADKTSRRSKKSSQLKAEAAMPVNNVETKESSTMHSDNSAQILTLPLQGSVKPTSSENSHTSSAEVQFRETINVAGVRPIASSDLQVAETVNMAGVRPIASSQLKVSETVNLVGMRFIASSSLQVSDTVLMSGMRPIASNNTEDTDNLIGYLD